MPDIKYWLNVVVLVGSLLAELLLTILGTIFRWQD